MSITRRLVLAVPVMLAAPAILRAQKPERLLIAAHRVHQLVATSAQGGDITKAWTARTGVGVEWLTFEVGPLQDRLFREASLPETSIDISFLLNTQLTPGAARLFEPLDALMAANPIEDMGDLFSGMVQASRIGGAQIAIPYRHTASGLHWNTQYFAERGIAAPPATIEEFFEDARRLSYTRADGARVSGFVLPGMYYSNVIDIARAWDGDFITTDFKVVANQGGMVKAAQALRDLYVAGALPRNVTTVQNEEVDTWMQQGRAAMCCTGISRSGIYGNPEKSKFPGGFAVEALPTSKELQPRMTVAPTKVEFWGTAIPRNSRHKELAWDLMREMTSKRAVMMMALNGNGPVRNSTYDDADYVAKRSYAPAERAVLKVARVPVPAFDNALRAVDIFREELEAAVLGMKPVQQALDDLTTRVKPLVVV